MYFILFINNYILSFTTSILIQFNARYVQLQYFKQLIKSKQFIFHLLSCISLTGRMIWFFRPCCYYLVIGQSARPAKGGKPNRLPQYRWISLDMWRCMKIYKGFCPSKYFLVTNMLSSQLYSLGINTIRHRPGKNDKKFSQIYFY